MIFAVVILITMAIAFGLPVLPILLVAAFIQGIMAYYLTRHDIAGISSIAILFLTILHYIFVPPVLAAFLPEPDYLATAKSVFDVIAAVGAVANLMLSTWIGLFGGLTFGKPQIKVKF